MGREGREEVELISDGDGRERVTMKEQGKHGKLRRNGGEEEEVHSRQA